MRTIIDLTALRQQNWKKRQRSSIFKTMTEQTPKTKDIIDKLRAHAPDLRERGILHASLFGSVARGEQTPASDIDLAVMLDPKHRVGLIALAGLQRHVSKLLNRQVDLVTLPVQRKELRSIIERETIRAF